MKNYKKAKALRYLCGMTQQEVAEVLWSSRGTVSKWETSENEIRPSSLAALHMLHFIVKSGQLESYLLDRELMENTLSEDMSMEVLASIRELGFVR
ncbi:helix-turn-helix transcriptional regulator [Vibrio fluvialis]|nr:helix-turn-helix transcriptional regulator [Vibrio fluvialis]